MLGIFMLFGDKMCVGEKLREIETLENKILKS